MSNIEILNSINSPEKFLEFLNNNMKYGYIDNKRIPHVNTLDGSRTNYMLHDIETILNCKTATCGDVVEIERYFFNKQKIKHNTYSVLSGNDVDNLKLHCFLTFEVSNKLFLFEQSWKYYRGIQEFKDKKHLLTEMMKRFIIRYDITDENFHNCMIVEYKKPNINMNFDQYVNALINEKNLLPEIIENKKFEEVKYSGFKKI